MAEINISGLPMNVIIAEFHVARARAIQSFAGIEQAMCTLFCRLLGISPMLGGIVFFRITTPRYRTEIIQKLIKQTGKTDFLEYWKSVETLLQKADQSRNEIVHWATIATINSDNPEAGTEQMRLTSPNISTFITNQNNTWTTVDLLQYKFEADQIKRLIDCLTGHVFDEVLQYEPWPEIFRQRVPDPIPTGHLLSLIPTV